MKTIMMQFLDELKKDGYNIPLEHYNSMLEIEKEQIIEAHAFGADDVDSNGGLLLRGVKNAIYYYNQTYNN
jgi:hypothetical protein